MSRFTDICDEVLAALRSRGALQRGELLPLTSAENMKQLSNVISRLKELSLIERANNMCWRVTEVGRVQNVDGGAAQKPAAAMTSAPTPAQPAAQYRERPQDDIEPTRTQSRSPSLQEAIQRRSAASDAIQSTLQRAAQQAQEALDEYVWQVGDERVLGPLMASRDAARQAMEAYQEAH